MDTQRLVTLAIFLVSSFLLWDAWQKYQHPPAIPPQAQTAPTTPGAPGAIPAPSAPTPTGAAQPAAASTPVAPGVVAPAATAVASGARVKVTTDMLEAEIDSIGGDLRRLRLLKHFAAEDQTKLLTLLEDAGTPFYIAQSGLIGVGMPNHTTRFSVEGGDRALPAGQDSVQVKMSAPGPEGVTVDKIYTFRRGSYVVDVGYVIHNATQQPLDAYAYYQFLRDGTPPPGDPRFINTYTGPAQYTEKTKFQKVAFSDVDKGKDNFEKKADNGWVAMLQHYFVAAWLPKPGVQREYFFKKNGDKLYSAGVILPVGKVAAGAEGRVEVPLYAGPQEVDKLKALAPGLDLTIDYGWLTIIASPLFWVLSAIHRIVGNWGVAIILLTVMIKLIFFPLSAASYKSMAKMRVVAPKLQRLKEQYGDDRQKLHTAMMELYKTEKINPLGGCLPVVVQIPVFISLYWVLLASVELRHAPFYGWIHDLSAQDPFYVLPVIMGISMLIQAKLNPTPPDPVQAKVMMIMPFAFSIFFFFFPAGLVLYWVVNNVLSIAQQWQITRMIEGKAAGAKK